MNKRSVLDIDFSSLERNVLITSRSHSKSIMQNLLQEMAKEQNNLIGKIGKMHTSAVDAMAYGMSIHSFVGDLFTLPEPHCQKKVFNIIDQFWSGKQSGLYGQYIEQLNRNPKTKDVFKGKSSTHHFPWYRRGSKY